MNGEVEEIKDVLNYYNSRFNRSHAQIYWCLLSGEVKTGKQIAQEIGLCKQTTYQYLNQLVAVNLVKMAKKRRASPAEFFIKNPAKELNKFLAQYLRKQTKIIEEKKEKIREIVNNKNSEFEMSWEIKVKGEKIIAIDKTENKALRERSEANKLKEAVEKFVKSLPEEKKYAIAYAIGRGK